MFTIIAFAETTGLNTFLHCNENSLIDVRDYNLFIFVILEPSTKCLIKFVERIESVSLTFLSYMTIPFTFGNNAT